MGRKAGYAGAAVLALLALGFFWYVKSQSFMNAAAAVLSEQAAAALRTEVRIESVSLHSPTELRADGVVVRDAAGRMLAAVKQLRVRFSPLSMLRGAPALASVDSVEAVQPTVELTRQDGVWNYEALLPAGETEPSAFRGRIYATDASIAVHDGARLLTLERLNGRLDFDAFPGVSFAAEFSHAGGEASLSGAWGGNRDAVSVKAKNFSIENYLDFLPEQMAVKLQKGLLKSLDVTCLRTDDGYRISGETTILGAALEVKGTTVEGIDGLVLFNEKNLRVFSRASIKEQPVVLRGTMSLDAAEPELDLLVTSDGFDASAVLPNFPLRGRIAVAANIRGRFSDPSIEGTFSVPEGEIAGYALRELRAKLYFYDDLLTVQEADGVLAGGRFSAAGRIAARDLSYHLRLRAEDIPAETFAAALPGLTGRIQADAFVDGAGTDFARAALRGSASILDGSYRGVAFRRFSADLAKRGDAIAVEAASLILPQGEIAAAGRIEGDRLDLRFWGGRVDLAQAAALQPALRLSGAADFSGAVAGTLAQPEARVEIAARDGAVFAQLYRAARGEVVLADGRVFTEGFVLENGAATHRISGSAGLDDGAALNLEIVSSGARAEDLVKLASLADAEAEDAPGLTGNVDNRVVITGTLADPQADGAARFYDGSFGGVLLKQAGGSYSWRNGQLTLRDFSVSAPNLKVAFSGVMRSDRTLDFTVAADEIDFGRLRLHLPYPVSGVGKFAGKVSGRADSPRFDGRLTADALVFNGQELQAVDGEVEYRDSSLTLTSFGFRQGKGVFHLTCGINLATEGLRGDLRIEQGNVAAILALFDLKNTWIDGELDGTMQLVGTAKKPRARLRGFIGEGRLKDYPLRHIAVDAALDGTVATINEFRAEQGEGLLVAKGTADMNGPLNLEIAGQNIDAGLLANLADSKLETAGTLSFGAQIGGTAENPQGNLSAEIRSDGAADAAFDTLYGLLRLQDGIIHVEQLLAQKGPYKASAYGVVPLAALTRGARTADLKNQMDLKISLDEADLSILPFLTRQVKRASGEMGGSVDITGTLAQPQVNGNILVKSGTVQFSGLGKPLQDLQLDLRFLGDRLELRNFTGVMGGGSFAMSGGGRIAGLGLSGYDFALDLNRLEIDNRYYDGPLEGRLRLTEDTAFGRVAPKLSGALHFEQCTADIPSLPEGEAALPPVRLDLSVSLGKKVRLYNPFLYDIWLEGHANFGGSTRHPQSSGEITATRGTINYLKTPFKVKEASAYFNQVSSFLPSLRLEADTRLQRAKVYLQINGPVDNMQIRLTSDPEMNESELLALLTMRSRYSGKEGDRGIGRDELMSLLDVGLQMSFLSEVEGAMRSAFGLDEFKVVRDTMNLRSSGKSASEEVYNIEIGKYVSDKLMLTYSRGVDYDSYKYGVRYEFTSRFSLTGSRDEENRSTVGIEARFKF